MLRLRSIRLYISLSIRLEEEDLRTSIIDNHLHFLQFSFSFSKSLPSLLILNISMAALKVVCLFDYSRDALMGCPGGAEPRLGWPPHLRRQGRAWEPHTCARARRLRVRQPSQQ